VLPLRHTGRWRLADIAVLVIVLAGTLAPKMPHVHGAGLHSDKWMHAITFMLLTVWFAGQYSRRSYWRIVVGMLAFGALVEICQRIVGYRSAEVMDFVADAIGILAGILIAWAGAGGWSLRFEEWIAERE